jgi:hypothetical protein
VLNKRLTVWTDRVPTDSPLAPLTAADDVTDILDQLLLRVELKPPATMAVPLTGLDRCTKCDEWGIPCGWRVRAVAAVVMWRGAVKQILDATTAEVRLHILLSDWLLERSEASGKQVRFGAMVLVQLLLAALTLAQLDQVRRDTILVQRVADELIGPRLSDVSRRVCTEALAASGMTALAWPSTAASLQRTIALCLRALPATGAQRHLALTMLPVETTSQAGISPAQLLAVVAHQASLKFGHRCRVALDAAARIVGWSMRKELVVDETLRPPLLEVLRIALDQPQVGGRLLQVVHRVMGCADAVISLWAPELAAEYHWGVHELARQTVARTMTGAGRSRRGKQSLVETPETWLIARSFARYALRQLHVQASVGGDGDPVSPAQVMLYVVAVRERAVAFDAVRCAALVRTQLCTTPATPSSMCILNELLRLFGDAPDADFAHLHDESIMEACATYVSDPADTKRYLTSAPAGVACMLRRHGAELTCEMVLGMMQAQSAMGGGGGPYAYWVTSILASLSTSDTLLASPDLQRAICIHYASAVTSERDLRAAGYLAVVAAEAKLDPVVDALLSAGDRAATVRGSTCEMQAIAMSMAIEVALVREEKVSAYRVSQMQDLMASPCRRCRASCLLRVLAHVLLCRCVRSHRVALTEEMLARLWLHASNVFSFRGSGARDAKDAVARVTVALILWLGSSMAIIKSVLLAVAARLIVNGVTGGGEFADTVSRDAVVWAARGADIPSILRVAGHLLLRLSNRRHVAHHCVCALARRVTLLTMLLANRVPGATIHFPTADAVVGATVRAVDRLSLSQCLVSAEGSGSNLAYQNLADLSIGVSLLLDHPSPMARAAALRLARRLPDAPPDLTTNPYSLKQLYTVAQQGMLIHKRVTRGVVVASTAVGDEDVGGPPALSLSLDPATPPSTPQRITVPTTPTVPPPSSTLSPPPSSSSARKEGGTFAAVADSTPVRKAFILFRHGSAPPGSSSTATMTLSTPGGSEREGERKRGRSDEEGEGEEDWGETSEGEDELSLSSSEDDGEDGDDDEASADDGRQFIPRRQTLPVIPSVSVWSEEAADSLPYPAY